MLADLLGDADRALVAVRINEISRSRSVQSRSASAASVA